LSQNPGKVLNLYLRYPVEKKSKILAVDDDREILRFYEEFLVKDGKELDRLVDPGPDKDVIPMMSKPFDNNVFLRRIHSLLRRID